MPLPLVPGSYGRWNAHGTIGSELSVHARRRVCFSHDCRVCVCFSHDCRVCFSHDRGHTAIADLSARPLRFSSPDVARRASGRRVRRRLDPPSVVALRRRAAIPGRPRVDGARGLSVRDARVARLRGVSAGIAPAVRRRARRRDGMPPVRSRFALAAVGRPNRATRERHRSSSGRRSHQPSLVLRTRAVQFSAPREYRRGSAPYSSPRSPSSPAVTQPYIFGCVERDPV